MTRAAKGFGAGSRWYGRIPITITLATAIGLLVLVAVGAVFSVGVWLAQKNTFDLLRANARQAIAAGASQFEQHLRPVENQTRFLAGQIAREEVDPADHEQFGQMLVGSLAGLRQIEAVMFINSDLQSFIAHREHRRSTVKLNVVDRSEDPVALGIMENVKQGAAWGPPVWREAFQKTYLNRADPVVRNGELIGAIVAVTSIEGLSNFISEHENDSAGNRFILYGKDRVLAHWLLIDNYPDRSTESPLPRLDTFGDPVLASIWQLRGRVVPEKNMADGTQDHLLRVFNDRYAFVYKSLDGYGPEPMIVGSYFQVNDSIKEIQRMSAALIAGIVALIASLVAAIFLGHRIARPIVRFSAAAARIRDLDVAEVEELPGSAFRELNDQSVAFNAMLRALCWFELYVPKKIVERLIRHADVRGTISHAREITVMFTDIVGFSAVSEGMQASEVADFVNHHFSLVARCIEFEEGTIDKFMGDAVMAFWGAPDDQTDCAARACRAACAIADAIREDNRQRNASGKPSVGIRIGIHTGIATVGNIGAPGRLNYTIIGDTVNIGQRLEQLGKEVYPAGTEISMLISGDTADRLSPAFETIMAGRFKLTGRMGVIDVLKLVAVDDSQPVS